MNKDVIYVEPEDDITDIILKIENSKEKIVALVPPKKAGVFRSVVNIKLIAKSGISSGKKIVLVTVDPSILRLAAAAKIPVTKDLQTAPTIPKADEEPETLKAETLVEESDGEVETEEDVEELLDDKDEDDGKEKDEEDEKSSEGDEEEESEDDKKEDDDKEEKKPSKSGKKDKAKAEKSGNKFVVWFKEHKKLAIAGCICGVLLIGFLVWAFVFAPSATISVAIKADSNNFSEAVTFTDKLSDENASEGKFYLEEKKIEDIKEVEFEATGKKNVGEKATGDVTVVATISADGGTVQVKAGDIFSNSGLNYVADKGVTMSFDGKDTSVCGNIDDNTTIKELREQGCKIYAKVNVTASEAGSKFNISARDNGWDSTAPVATYSTNAMSGGTDAEITIVQQIDVEKAKESLAAANENENKEKLLSDIDKNLLVIDSSFKQSTGEVIATPNVGEEVKDGTTPKLKAVTTASVLVVDRTKLEEFITKKADLKEDQKIYEMKDPFIENFTLANGAYSGKLKTTYLSGPRVTVSSIVDMVKGKGFGDAQHALKDIAGITDVHITGSFPWVSSVPNDSNKITVEIKAKDQNGTDIKIDTKDEDKKSDSGEGKEEKESSSEEDKKEEKSN